MVQRDGTAARQAHGPEGEDAWTKCGVVHGGAGRALVLLGMALFPAGDAFRCVEYVIPTL